jgi:hypothetical protein
MQMLLGSGTPTAALGTTNNSVVSFAVAGTIPVTKGTNYWLVLKPGGSSVLDLWMETSMNGTIAHSLDDSTWHTAPLLTPAFRLTSVPDSGATLLLMISALAGLFILQRVALRGQDTR